MRTLLNFLQNEEQMEIDFLHALRQREIPSRFSYWGESETHGWLNVCKSKRYGVFNKGLGLIKKYSKTLIDEVDSEFKSDNVIIKNGVELIDKNVKKVIKNVGSISNHKINYISLGIGNGEKDSLIINSLLNHKYNIKYFPIDISLEMIKEGMKNTPHDKIETAAFIADFRNFSELSNRIRDNHYDNNLVSIFGNTLGNFGQIEILNSLKKGMKMNDFLMIEITLRQDKGSKTTGENLTELIESYNNEDYKDFVFTPLKKVGFCRGDGIIEVEYGPNRYYPKLYSIETWFRILKDKIVHYRGEDIVFKKDERIRLYVSHKYTRHNITELLDGNGFEICDFFDVEDNSYGLILSKLKKE